MEYLQTARSHVSRFGSWRREATRFDWPTPSEACGIDMAAAHRTTWVPKTVQTRVRLPPPPPKAPKNVHAREKPGPLARVFDWALRQAK